MSGGTFKIGGIYGLKVQGIVRQDGVNFFTLQYKGKTTKPQWAKRGLSYHTPILPEQEETDTEKFIGQTIQCRVAYFMEGFPVLEQVNEPNQTPSTSLLPIFNHNATAQKSKKTSLRGVSSNRRQTKEPVCSPKPTIQPSIPIPNEEQRVLVGVIPPQSKEQTHPQLHTPSQPKQDTSTQRSKLAPEQKADAGDADALYQLGVEAEKRGKKAQAHQFFSQAAEHGHMEAQYALGKLYLEKALKLIEQAAANGDLNAQNELAKLLAQIMNPENNSAENNPPARHDSPGSGRAIHNIQQGTKKTETIPHNIAPIESPTTEDKARDAIDAVCNEPVDEEVAKSEEPASEQTERSGSDETVCEMHPVDLTRSVAKPEYYAWRCGSESDAKASLELEAVSEASTETHGADGEADMREIPHIVGAPEAVYAQTEEQACDMTATEIQNVDLRPVEAPRRTGCFFCRMLDKITTFLSRK